MYAVTVGLSSLFVTCGRQIAPLELLTTAQLVLGLRLIAIVHFVAAICVCCVANKRGLSLYLLANNC